MSESSNAGRKPHVPQNATGSKADFSRVYFQNVRLLLAVARFVIPKRDLELGYFHWYWTGGIDETRIVKNAAEEKRCGRFAAMSEREKLLARIERKMVDYKKVLSQPGTLAHKRLVRALLRENDWSAWAVAYGEDDPGTVEYDRIPEGFLEAHAIGGSVGYHGLGHFALFDSKGNYVKLVD